MTANPKRDKATHTGQKRETRPDEAVLTPGAARALIDSAKTDLGAGFAKLTDAYNGRVKSTDAVVLTSDFDLPRDKFTRPVFEGRAWTRPSTLAGSLSDKSGLVTWKGRQVAEAILNNRDLLALGDPTEIVEAADCGGAAEYGSTVHQHISEILLHGVVA